MTMIMIMMMMLIMRMMLPLWKACFWKQQELWERWWIGDRRSSGTRKWTGWKTMKTVWTDKNNTDNSLRLTWEPERWDQLPKNVFDKNNNNTDLVRQNTHSTADSNNHTKVNSYKDLRIQNQITPFLVRWVWAGLPVFIETHCQPTIYHWKDTPNVNFFKKTM